MVEFKLEEMSIVKTLTFVFKTAEKTLISRPFCNSINETVKELVSVSAMTHPWHKESRVLCPAILFPIYRGEDSCML
ncbi:MAG: hypothetical protein ACI3Y9_00860, partial [Candidatus Cryptobacteroides sp.]